jgi:glucose-6-phosphate dehydrogenase assembly protein OpcA
MKHAGNKFKSPPTIDANERNSYANVNAVDYITCRRPIHSVMHKPMSNRDAEQSVLLGAPREVDLAAIERELVQLWKQAYEGGERHTGVPVVRACALNLVVVTGRPDEVDAISTLVGDVTLEHPARIFLVILDGQRRSPSLDAWVSARCSIPAPGGKQVCCEQITLVASGEESGKIPSIVTSLLVADVPTVLLWNVAMGTSDQLLTDLAGVCNLIILDSPDDATTVATLVAWHEFVKLHRDRTSFGDLSWSRLASWRSILAQAYHPEHMRNALATIREVTIEYVVGAQPPRTGLGQALLLTGWLAHALGWESTGRPSGDGKEGHEMHFRNDGRSLRVRIVRRDSPARTGKLWFVGVRSDSKMEIQLHATDQANCIRMHQQNDETREHLVPVVSRSEPELVAMELEDLSSDNLYETSLAALSTVFKETR